MGRSLQSLTLLLPCYMKGVNLWFGDIPITSTDKTSPAATFQHFIQDAASIVPKLSRFNVSSVYPCPRPANSTFTGLHRQRLRTRVLDRESRSQILGGNPCGWTFQLVSLPGKSSGREPDTRGRLHLSLANHRSPWYHRDLN